MKVCIIASRLFVGGFTSSMLNMELQLRRNKIEVDYLFLDADHHELPLDENSKILPFHLIRSKRTDIQRQLRILINKNKLQAIDKELSMTSDPVRKKKLSIKKTQLAIENSVLNRMPIKDMREYDCVVSWEELTCNDYLAMNIKAKKKIGYIHPEYKKAGYDPKEDRRILKKLDRIVCVSESTSQSLKEVFPEFKEKIIYIPNVLDADEIIRKSKEEEAFEKSTFDIVTVCRLSVYTKALDRLLRIAKRLEEAGMNYRWYVVGGGEGKEELLKLQEELEVDNVRFVGEKQNPYPYIKAADLFVLQSNYEGRPVVVDEAIILNTPVLVTAYESAYEQVDETIGYIVEMEEEKIYSQIKEIIEGQGKLKTKKENLKKYDKSKYSNIDAFLRELD